MRKSILFPLIACLYCIGKAAAGNVLTVADVNVPQGGQATIEIGCNFNTEYTAFELQLSLPDGLSLVTDEYGKPVIEKCLLIDHVLSGSLLSDGNYKFTCYHNENLSMPTSGALLRVTVQADASLALGSMHTARIFSCEFTRTADSMGEDLDDVVFPINITEMRTILDEEATKMPVAEGGADVRVKRTIYAGRWNTICLPFAMTDSQTRQAFGDGVELADFSGWTAEEDEAGETISLYFKSVSKMDANHPYFIHVEKDVTEFIVDGVNIEPVEEPLVQVGKRLSERGYMVSSYIVTAVPENGLFINKDTFCYSDGQQEIKAFRAWFDLTYVLQDTETSNVKLFIDDTETSVYGVLPLFPDDTTVYDLQGRKIAEDNAQRGIFIFGRKKVLK
ncbi:MAG: hypothetical protein IK144_09715 [Bacteroidaceae bacterium]|nr:hypothetical protein [Bacteroidaceae bacterium]